MSQTDPIRRFRAAFELARANWAEADPARTAALAGCDLTPDGVVVPFFGAPHLVTHPAGEVIFQPTGKPAHVSVVIALIHYLLNADGVPSADSWVTFRELPDGLFYARSFANRAETPLATRFGEDLEGFRQAASALGGTPLDLADVSFRFQALPRLALAVLVWEGDEEFPGQARILFDAHAGHYLPTEDLSGLGDWLAHQLAR